MHIVAHKVRALAFSFCLKKENAGKRKADLGVPPPRPPLSARPTAVRNLCLSDSGSAQVRERAGA